ncbi:MAG TPA: type II toxin-antitoxin system RelE/ParE family toxin [Thiobacillus sp.]|nr:type II toxin-antitoxin system RelE/ParE family toxin [Thiobacillus sp.]
MVIEPGQADYVALYEIESPGMVTVLAVRHQRESNFL